MSKPSDLPVVGCLPCLKRRKWKLPGGGFFYLKVEAFYIRVTSALDFQWCVLVPVRTKWEWGRFQLGFFIPGYKGSGFWFWSHMFLFLAKIASAVLAIPSIALLEGWCVSQQQSGAVMPQTVSHLGNTGGSRLYREVNGFFGCVLSWVCRQCGDPKLV